MTEEFFYTLDHPHRWTSGPIIVTSEDNGAPIASLARAKELAESNYVGGSTEDTCHTSYGVRYRTDAEAREREERERRASEVLARLRSSDGC